ncbi:hypothetical protein ABZ400_01880 [Streptomyces sp. NPDC005897]|uniref:hypothetical protein n=1 Tax=Streptomyces sp. NPDC005897 TaxID=3157081 RepID=UPI0033C7AA71
MSAWICEGCGNEVTGKIRRGRCEPCYRRHLKQVKKSTPQGARTRREYQPRKPAARPAIDRILARTTPGWGGCVIYTGLLNEAGYGVISHEGRPIGAHRLAYLKLVGEIPPGQMLDHLCHSSDVTCEGGSTCTHRRCVNPSHLEPVSPVENNLRGRGRSAENFFKEKCVNGHPFTPENTLLQKRLRSDGNPTRRCRECRRVANRKWYRTTGKRRRTQDKAIKPQPVDVAA